ncbi:ribosome small subunit-dependent GTPase A [Tunicatimonas pelagia]|uniref:ribosome small subunit-dependent GTPase A n=1 Tax=Tunicatimonas pelagia TaxID=931531 RepID=UPI002666B22E|nr:ribosome small subunit-dependent GTPase A [Tunicatimonas pelagia]WKN41115.1 ribosome small subunit-dependent GTPase A [Tunicatimonas pelagia]
MELAQLGFTGKIRKLVDLAAEDESAIGRVVVEHKERYVVQTTEGIFSAEITGNLRFVAQSRRDFPAVGDWVKIAPMDANSVVILKILPRTSVLERQAVGQHGETQLIATNIDYAFLVQATGHDFNLKRLERYLTICHASHIKPIIILTKIDLVENKAIEQLISQLNDRIKEIPIIALSSETGEGFDQLLEIMQPHQSYCFLGSSGVGKSTIVNRLNAQPTLKTSAISYSTNKGRHTTSHRELLLLPNQSIVIDTPGMREVGMTDQATGLEQTYDEITDLARNCRFNNCTHTHEQGCAVTEAVSEGSISEEAYNNYLKLKREQEHFSSTVREKRQKGKAQDKLYKAIQTERRKNKY